MRSFSTLSVDWASRLLFVTALFGGVAGAQVDSTAEFAPATFVAGATAAGVGAASAEQVPSASEEEEWFGAPEEEYIATATDEALGEKPCRGSLEYGCYQLVAPASKVLDATTESIVTGVCQAAMDEIATYGYGQYYYSTLAGLTLFIPSPPQGRADLIELLFPFGYVYREVTWSDLDGLYHLGERRDFVRYHRIPFQSKTCRYEEFLDEPTRQLIMGEGLRLQFIPASGSATAIIRERMRNEAETLATPGWQDDTDEVLQKLKTREDCLAGVGSPGQ